MYPNPQDVVPLPPNPNLENYRKRAKALVKAAQLPRGDDAAHDAVTDWALEWIEQLTALHNDSAAPDFSRDSHRLAEKVAAFARARITDEQGALAQAQFVIARAHGFGSWTKLADHISGMQTGASDVSAFELAVEAIVSGKLIDLQKQLAAAPALIHARSSRGHQATLLHYVAANGVENYRQKTPANIVEIARLLLDSGADVNAEADVYGGGARTLGLVVTSAHPRARGLQIPLADLLIANGAAIDTGIVNACLMNGCPEAAAHMAKFAGRLTLAEAAGISDLDAIAHYFIPQRTALDVDAARAMIAAAWYDRRDAISLLAAHGVDVNVRDPKDGDTALHIAAYQGQADLVDLLLSLGANVNVIDDVYKTPPMVWALQGWLVENRPQPGDYRRILRLLAAAGAAVKRDWIDDERVREDADLYAALQAAADRTANG